MALQIQKPNEPTRKGAYLDFMITGKNIDIIRSKQYKSPSDHDLIEWDFQVKNPQKQKPIKIPNIMTSKKITLEALKNSEENASSFLEQVQAQRLINHNSIMKLVRPHKKVSKLLNILLELDNPTKATQVVNEFWEKEWIETEEKRWSIESREAYDKLRRILKYHLFEKKDGGIINKLLS